MEELRQALGELCLEGDDLKVAETPENLLGRSQFAVYKGVYKSMRVAVKLIPLMGGQDLNLLQREINGLKMCAGPSVLHLYGVFIRQTDLAIVTELMSGSLAEYSYGPKKGQLTFKQKTLIALELARGILHIHQFGFVHRDIKPENAMIDDFMRPKWGDFGLVAALLTTNVARTESHGSGTPHFMSPEQMDADGDTPVTRATDIYAFGSTMLALYACQLPWPATMTQIQLLRKVLMGRQKPTIPTDLPESVQKLLSWCLEFEAKDRPTAEQLVQALEQIKMEADGMNAQAVSQPPPVQVQQSDSSVQAQAPSQQSSSTPTSAAPKPVTPSQPQPIPTSMTSGSGSSVPSAPTPVTAPVVSPQPVLTPTQIIDKIYEAATNHMYGRGGVTLNAMEASRLMRQAAEAGHPRAMATFGAWFIWGAYYLNYDKRAASHFLACAAKAGDKFGLAIAVRDGLGGYAKDAKRSFDLLNECDRNDPTIIYHLGAAYMWGHGTTADIKTGFHYFDLAARHGHAQAHNYVGAAYRLATMGVERDWDKGYYHCKVAHEMGSALATGWLGIIYRLGGQGAPQDVARGVQLTQQAVARGCHYAINEMGTIHEHGQGLPKDFQKAVMYYQQAASLGNPLSIQRLKDLGYPVPPLIQ